MKLEFRRMSEVPCADYIALNTHPLVRRLMPLSDEEFDEAACAEWLKWKESIWDEHGYGPWAFFVDGNFAGWGGLQPEGEDADLGIVLHPAYWGMGKPIYEEILRRAFEEMHLPSVTALLPPTRTRVRGLLRLGFVPDGEVVIHEERFLRYRLHAPRERAVRSGE